MVKLTVVIPTYNEEEHIDQTINKIYSNLSRLRLKPEIIVVDDSDDNTYSILKKVARVYKSLRVIHRDNSKGVGSAIRLGISKARGDYVIIFMGDAPDDVKYFPVILKKLEEGYDIVQTSRFIGHSKMIGYPFKKRIATWLCNNFIRIIFLKFELKDFSSLFKGFNKKKIKALNLESNEFDFGLELVLKAIHKKYKVVEVPVNWFERKQGKSKLKLSKFAKHYLNRVIKIWMNC